MKNMVRFRAADAIFVVPAPRVLGVRAAREVKPLPGQREGVAGLLERDGRVLTVVSPLVAHGAHVLILESAEGVLGLLAESEIGPPPPGQARPLIEGVLTSGAGLEFLLSVAALWTGLDALSLPETGKPAGRLADELPLRLLLVEDNVVVQKVMKRLLEKIGYTPDLALNGREGVDAIGRTHYDMVFMDVQMPEMGGLEAARTLTRGGVGHRPVIIAMTAAESDAERQACFDAGMDGLLTKPVTETNLRATLGTWGRRSGATPSTVVS